MKKPIVAFSLVVELCSSHGIFTPDAFTNLGIPEDLITPHVRKHRSSFNSPSSTIFVNGQAVESVTGVYGMEMLTQVCRDLGVSTETQYMGRVWQTRELKERLNKHLDEKALPPAFQDLPPIA